MMKIQKRKNDISGLYDYTFTEGDQHLRIYFAGNLDLYLVLGHRHIIQNEDTELSMDITKADYSLFQAFDTLYKEITSGYIYTDEETYPFPNHSYKGTDTYKRLVDEDKRITWISDDGYRMAEDRMTIEKVDEDSYRLTFKRNSIPMPDGFKSPFGITVRIRNSGSYYDPFNVSFMKMYNRIQEIDPYYHQMSIDEYEYQKKKGLKL